MGFNYIHSQTVFTQVQQENSGITSIWLISVSTLLQVLWGLVIQYLTRLGMEMSICSAFYLKHKTQQHRIIFNHDKSISSNLFKVSLSAKTCMIATNISTAQQSGD